MEDIRQSQVRVCALESQPIVAQGLSEAFARHGGLTLSAWCLTEVEVTGLVVKHEPQILLIDPLAANGNLLGLTSRLAAGSGPVAALVWSEGLSPAERRLMGGLGTASIVERCLAADDLIALCLRVAGGPKQATALDGASEVERGARRLTPKEAEVARLASGGLKNREIAASLGIAQGTVKVHLMHVFEKTGLRDRQQLSGFAARLFPPTNGAPAN